MDLKKPTNSNIIEIGAGKPVIGIVGLVHGDEVCGRKMLDELASSKLNPKGTIKLIYANLEAGKKNTRWIDGNLNRVFPGNKDGNIEERTAYELCKHLAGCDYVLDIHSTSYPTEPFIISVKDDLEFDELASFTGLNKYVIMIDKMASGGSLIDEVARSGGKGISFESGIHEDENSIIVARKVIYNFLINLGVLEGESVKNIPEKFYGKDMIKVPSDSFKAYNTIKNFEILNTNTNYGFDESGEHRLDYSCYPILFSNKLIDGIVFLVGEKN